MLANPDRAAETKTKIPASATFEGLPAAWASAGAPSEACELVGPTKNLSKATLGRFGYLNDAASTHCLRRRYFDAFVSSARCNVFAAGGGGGSRTSLQAPALRAQWPFRAVYPVQTRIGPLTPCRAIVVCLSFNNFGP